MNENVNQITFRKKQVFINPYDNERYLKRSIGIAREGHLALTNNKHTKSKKKKTCLKYFHIFSYVDTQRDKGT